MTSESRKPAPLVSVVVAHHDTNPGFVSECIASVEGQTYPKSAMELILVDDASSQQSIEGVRAILGDVHALEANVIELPRNQGPGAARNAGIEAAQGEFVFILDDDDVAESDAISQCVAASQPDAALVYTDNTRWDTSLEHPILVRRKALFHKLHSIHKGTMDDPLLHLHMVHYCQLYRRNALDAVGGYRASLFTGGDYDLNLRIAGLSDKVNFIHVPQSLHRYRNNPSGITSTRRSAQIANTCKALGEAYERWELGHFDEVAYLGQLGPWDHSFFTPLVGGQPVRVSWVDYDGMQVREETGDIPVKDATRVKTRD